MGSAYLLVHALVAAVNFGAEACFRQGGQDILGIFGVAVGDGDDHGLHRGQPGRERAAVMLDQDAEEPLHGSQNGAMHHVGAAASSLVVLVGEVEALRQVEVELDGGALPSPAQGVGDVDVNLGAVESAAALVHGEGQVTGFQRAL